MNESDKQSFSEEPKRGRGRPRKADAATPAERQQRSRAKRANRADGELPLSIMIGYDAVAAFSRLANHYGLTRQQMFEKIVVAADLKVQDEVRALGKSQYRTYMERKLTRKQKDAMEIQPVK